ncbi:type II secretion system protein M [Candidatus Enterovibrio altilux]|uniref:Type II secretion system protein M n=2 Tax=Candidatus Enterovibrio altilux TaxID=1927128 RepID=A0A291B8Y6_9GAMM|nr:type II secretion system protein M [Candidatus Enterovibrio luxaltus]ATF09486.1 General secretion pathway protein M [Candidatus Enterovibrio luxaltus]
MKAILAYWQRLSRREQLLLNTTSGALLLGAFYWSIISPLQNRTEQAQQRLSSEKILLTWVTAKATEITTLRAATGNNAQVMALSLNQAVTASVKRYDLEIIRLQSQQDELQVWLKPIPFNTLLIWLNFLATSHDIQVKSLNLSKADMDGVVEVKGLQLGRR